MSTEPPENKTVADTQQQQYYRSIAEQCFNEKSFSENSVEGDDNYEFPWMSIYLAFLVLFHLMHAYVTYDQYKILEDEKKCQERFE